ncbi:MAG: YbaN family protein [Clostridiaceae bacterium]|nr:YbaN family protein [Clostridiaceae bacterium]
MKIFLSALGLICFALGAIGVFLPILPTTPFLMVSAFCFAKSSPKLNNWFKGTNLYKKHLKSYTESRSMTVKTKVTIMMTVTVLMSGGFIMMDAVPIGRAFLCFIWVCHAIYLVFRVKTIPDPARNR